MSERYSKVFALSENLYATGSPIIIEAGALQKDNQTGGNHWFGVLKHDIGQI